VVEAARIITTRNVQNVIVVDDGRFAGFAPPCSPPPPSTPAARALALKLAGHVPVLPVVDPARRLVGVLTIREPLSTFFFPETPRAPGQS
jgi:hypothetical protein